MVKLLTALKDATSRWRMLSEGEHLRTGLHAAMSTYISISDAVQGDPSERGASRHGCLIYAPYPKPIDAVFQY